MPSSSSRRRSAALGAAAVMFLASLSACGGATDDAPATSAGPAVTVQDCTGKTVTVAADPRRVVTLDGYAAQAMARLGLSDRIVGTGFPAPFAVDQGPLKAELGRIPVVAPQVPSTELVAAQRPDLVLTAFSAFGGAPGSPKDSDLATLGVPGIAGCVRSGKLNDLEPTYAFLRKLGTVFRVPQRAEQLVGELQAREKAVAAKAPQGAKPRVMVLVDNPVAGQPVPTSGATTIANALIVKAGGVNVFGDVTTMHANVSPEQVVQRDPEVIWVITDYSFAKVKGQALVDQVKTNPLLAATSAAKNGRILATSQFLVAFPSPLNLDGLEQLSAGLTAGS